MYLVIKYLIRLDTIIFFEKLKIVEKNLRKLNCSYVKVSRKNVFVRIFPMKSRVLSMRVREIVILVHLSHSHGTQRIPNAIISFCLFLKTWVKKRQKILLACEICPGYETNKTSRTVEKNSAVPSWKNGILYIIFSFSSQETKIH